MQWGGLGWSACEHCCWDSYRATPQPAPPVLTFTCEVLLQRLCSTGGRFNCLVCQADYTHCHTDKAQRRLSHHHTPAPEGLSAWWLLEPESVLHLQGQAKSSVGSRQVQPQQLYLCFHFGFHLQLQAFLLQCQLNTKLWDTKHLLARLSGADPDRLWLQLMLVRTAKVFCIE